MRVPYTLPLLPELARVNVMIVGGHLDNLHVSAACRMPALAFRLALATMSLPAVVVVRVMVRKTWKAERGASAASGYPAHDTRTLPTHWRGSAGPWARVTTLTSNVRQRRSMQVECFAPGIERQNRSYVTALCALHSCGPHECSRTTARQWRGFRDDDEGATNSCRSKSLNFEIFKRFLAHDGVHHPYGAMRP